MANWNKNDVFRLLSLNSILIFAFSFGRIKLLVQTKWYPMAFMSLMENRRKVLPVTK